MNAGVPIGFIFCQPFLSLWGECTSTAGFSANTACGQWKAESGFGIFDYAERLGVGKSHGYGGGTKRAGFFDGMQQTAGTFPKKFFIVVGTKSNSRNRFQQASSSFIMISRFSPRRVESVVKLIVP